MLIICHHLTNRIMSKVTLFTPQMYVFPTVGVTSDGVALWWYSSSTLTVMMDVCGTGRDQPRHKFSPSSNKQGHQTLQVLPKWRIDVKITEQTKTNKRDLQGDHLSKKQRTMKQDKHLYPAPPPRSPTNKPEESERRQTTSTQRRKQNARVRCQQYLHWGPT